MFRLNSTSYIPHVEQQNLDSCRMGCLSKTWHGLRLGSMEKRNGPATEIVLIRPGAFIKATPSPLPIGKMFHLSWIKVGDNSKPSVHFGSHWHILGAGHRDFLDCSPTGSKSAHQCPLLGLYIEVKLSSSIWRELTWRTNSKNKKNLSKKTHFRAVRGAMELKSWNAEKTNPASILNLPFRISTS